MKILVALWLMMMEQLCARYAIKDWLLLILENVTSKRFILLEGQLLAKFAKQWWRKDHFISMPNKFTEWVRKLWKISSNLTNSWNKIVYYNTILRKNFLFLIDFHCACAEKLCCNFTIFFVQFHFCCRYWRRSSCSKRRKRFLHSLLQNLQKSEICQRPFCRSTSTWFSRHKSLYHLQGCRKEKIDLHALQNPWSDLYINEKFDKTVLEYKKETI